MAASQPKTDDDTTAEIVSTIESIVLSMKKDTDGIRSDLAATADNVAKLRNLILPPEEISKLIEAHLTPLKEENKDIKQNIASLKSKSQMRMTMDPEFIAELKQIAEEQARQAVADVTTTNETFTPEQLEAMKQEFVKYQRISASGGSGIRQLSDGDESHALPRLMKNLSMSARIKPFVTDGNIGFASMDGQRNKFREQQEIHAKAHAETRRINVTNSRVARLQRSAEIVREKTILEVVSLVDKQLLKLQGELDTLMTNNPGTVDPEIIADIEEKKQEILSVQCKKIDALSTISLDPKDKVALETQASDMFQKMAHQQFRVCQSKSRCCRGRHNHGGDSTDNDHDHGRQGEFDAKLSQLKNRKFKQ